MAPSTARREDYWETAAAGGGGSRPSETNCTTGGSDTSTVENLTMRSRWWKRKNELVDTFVEERPEYAVRPLSVRNTQTIREECTSEKGDGRGRRAKSWSACMNEFLNWYNGYRYAHLTFRNPDGDLVRSLMPNAHQPKYGNTYYARIKALERQIIKDFDNPYTAMLTFSGSNRNDGGGLRCPADHLRDVIDSWRPNRGRGVYHALDTSLSGRKWEYAVVLEHHKSGYGHVHCAVFVDGEIEESDFHGAIDAHLRHCDIAHRDAHDYFSTDEKDRPISVRKVNPDLDVDDYSDHPDEVGNLGSYIGEYIGSYGAELFDRDVSELQFRTAVWATGSQMVRFSKGANELIAQDRNNDRGDRVDRPELDVEPDPKFDFDGARTNGVDDDQGNAWNVENEGWTLEGVGRVDEEGEELHDVGSNGVQYVTVDDAQHLDPPRELSAARPRRRTSSTSIADY